MKQLIPTTPAERIPALDFLRGIAIFGILFINIESFAYPNPWSSWRYGFTSEVDHDTRFWVYFLTQGKFYSMFALLFGVGFAIFIDRAKLKVTGVNLLDLYTGRLFWLFLIGVFHAYFIWDGDILYHYAICGLLLLPFRSMSNTSILLAILFIASFPLINAFDRLDARLDSLEKYELAKAKEASLRDEADQRIITNWEKRYSKKEPLSENVDPPKPTYWQGLEHTFDHLEVHKGSFYHKSIILSALIVMLIGLLLYRSGIFIDYHQWKFYWPITFSILICSLSINYLRYYHWTYLDHMPVTQWWKVLAFTFPRESLGISYILLLNGIYQNFLSGRTKLISTIGQTALSNYVLQNLILGLLFYGYGLGLHNSFSRVELLLFLPLIWFIQLIATTIWLKYHSQGPLEKLWRKLTYNFIKS